MKLWRLTIALDQVLNVVTGGLPGQTLSGRAQTARNQGKRWGCVLCRVLDWADKGHCAKALEADIARAKAVVVDSKETT